MAHWKSSFLALLILPFNGKALCMVSTPIKLYPVPLRKRPLGILQKQGMVELAKSQTQDTVFSCSLQKYNTVRVCVSER